MTGKSAKCSVNSINTGGMGICLGTVGNDSLLKASALACALVFQNCKMYLYTDRSNDQQMWAGVELWSLFTEESNKQLVICLEFKRVSQLV